MFYINLNNTFDNRADSMITDYFLFSVYIIACIIQDLNQVKKEVIIKILDAKQN